jgi:hypothetical protein
VISSLEMTAFYDMIKTLQKEVALGNKTKRTISIPKDEYKHKPTPFETKTIQVQDFMFGLESSSSSFLYTPSRVLCLSGKRFVRGNLVVGGGQNLEEVRKKSDPQKGKLFF